ncbi:MAG TPA: DHA2 family efflux MFS transporter permease subunit [Candidatus Elarobacter sp.]|nr:DHA2 family efflux MFS transporter permease subunit [Candidatus Elarobacter sp.]
MSAIAEPGALARPRPAAGAAPVAAPAAAAHRGPSLSAPNPWVLIGVVMVGNFLGPLYSSVANVVLPNLVASFGSDVETMEWVVTGYMLGYSIAMPVAGWLADTFGRRRMYLLGLAIFTGASVLTALAWDSSSLIAFRILQAIGGGIISPTSMALITDVVPPAQRGRALGVWGLGMMLAPTFGPVVSGWIVDNFDDWRLIFLLGIPFGVAGLLLSYAKIPHDDARTTRAPFDVWGFSLLTVALAAFLIPLTQGERVGWDDPLIGGSFALALASFAGFIWRELRTAHPMMDLSLFAQRTFSLAVGLRAVLGMGYYFAIFLLPLFTQNVLGWTPTTSGLVLMPAGLAMALLMPLSGMLSDKIGARWLVLAGVATAAAGTLLFAKIDIDWDVTRIAVDSLIRTAALGLMFTPLTAVALAAIPRTRAGSASGILNTVWQVGGSLGIAIGQTYLTNRTALRLSDAAGQVVPARPAVADAMQALSAHLSPAAAQAMLAKETVLMATVQAYGDTFLLAAVVMACGIPAALLLPGMRKHSRA